MPTLRDDRNAAQNDLQDAQQEFREAQTEFNQKQQDQGLPSDVALPHDVDQLEQRSDTLADDIRTTQYLTALVILVLALLYLVPVTAKTGSTLGMRGRKIKVVRVDGSPVGWYPAFARFVIPILLALGDSRRSGRSSASASCCGVTATPTARVCTTSSPGPSWSRRNLDGIRAI